MQSKKEELQNRQLIAMLIPAKERLRKYSIEEICRKAAVSFDESEKAFFFRSLGKDIRVRYPDFELTISGSETPGMWHHLTLLQYLDTADGEPLSEEWQSLAEMPGGLSRGAGFNKDIETMISRSFSSVSTEDFTQLCLRMDARIIPSRADVTAEFSYAPRFPILLNYWAADDEFPASGKCLVRKGAEHYLSIEAAGGACSAVVEALQLQGPELKIR